ncbi:BSD domain-containing protein 1-like [Patiria miniata]|uniref:BSD domain-containing protein n=1 Tax=Patiria miniata TaxID=46514 RepID=A0A913ZZC2_PATMI|nr:BSD domain-containing protein 1-like [Patiria miniata]
MATGSGGNDEGSWWGGWIQAAKEKSAVALEQMKRDLGEFGSTIQRDTSSAVATSAGVIRESLQTEPDESSTSSRVKKGFSDLLGGLSESLAPKNPSNEETQAVSSKTSHHIFDRAKARLHSMQIDAGTYCTDPEGPAHVYEDWLLSFDTDKYKGDISDLLVSNTDVRAIYTKLVPAVVSNADFWGRYFYKVHQLEQDEARRTALKERADMTSSQTFDIEELQWDEDEEDSSATVGSLECRNTSMKQQDYDDRVASPAGSRWVDGGLECPKPNVDEKDELVMITATESATEQPCQHQRLTKEPETQPMEPETEPVEPEIEPVEPETEPMEPETEPVEPETEPVEPETEPVEPETEPVEPETEPVEPETKPVDREDKTTTVRTSSSSEQERDTGNHCHERTQRVLDTQGEYDTENNQQGREGIQNMEPSDKHEEDKDHTQSEDSNATQATHSRSMNAGVLMVHVPTEETQLDKQIEKKTSPSGSDASNKDSSLSDDWERDFDDIDVTEEDLAAAAAIQTKAQPNDDNEDEDLDDWESWE